MVELKEKHVRGGAQSGSESESGAEASGPEVRRWTCESSSTVGGTSRSNAVVSLSPCPSDSVDRCFGPGRERSEAEAKSSVYLVARKRGVVDCLDAASGSSRLFLQAKFEDEEENLVGLKIAASGKLLTCSTKGKVEIWGHPTDGDDDDDDNEGGDQTTRDDTGSPLLARSLAEISASARAPVETFEVCPKGLAFATGGRENNVKLFDVETQKNVFLARSPKPNELGIWDKPWITSLCFLDRNSSVVLCGTANHQLRLYDTRVKRRPVFEIEWGENKIGSLCLQGGADGENLSSTGSVWCGNAIGQLAMLDLKTKTMVGSLKGTLGSVRHLSMHPTKPNLLFSCGLDRFLRVYDVQKRQQVCRVFLKQYMNTLDVMPETNVDNLLLTSSNHNTAPDAADAFTANDVHENETEEAKAMFKARPSKRQKKKRKKI